MYIKNQEKKSVLFAPIIPLLGILPKKKNPKLGKVIYIKMFITELLEEWK